MQRRRFSIYKALLLFLREKAGYLKVSGFLKESYH